MRIALINPSCREGISGIYPSLGLGYIAAVLEKNNLKPDYLDVDASEISEKNLKLYFLKNKPEIVGIGCTSFNFSEGKKIAKIVKQTTKNAVVVIGGPHASIYPLEILKTYFLIDNW